MIFPKQYQILELHILISVTGSFQQIKSKNEGRFTILQFEKGNEQYFQCTLIVADILTFIVFSEKVLGVNVFSIF